MKADIFYDTNPLLKRSYFCHHLHFIPPQWKVNRSASL